MKKTEKPAAKAAAKPQPKPITSLQEFQALVDQTCTCIFTLETPKGRELRSVPVKRISPALAEQARELERKFQPPWKKEMAQYDQLDPAYLQKREVLAKKVRSLIVYSCCPTIAAAKPGLTALEDIHAFVQTLLAENILSAIAMKAQEGGFSLQVDQEVEERANFISPAGSES